MLVDIDSMLGLSLFHVLSVWLHALECPLLCGLQAGHAPRRANLTYQHVRLDYIISTSMLQPQHSLPKITLSYQNDVMLQVCTNYQDYYKLTASCSSYIKCTECCYTPTLSPQNDTKSTKISANMKKKKMAHNEIPATKKNMQHKSVMVSWLEKKKSRMYIISHATMLGATPHCCH